jgi:hypothetical protein
MENQQWLEVQKLLLNGWRIFKTLILTNIIHNQNIRK